ncbi:class I SAM-dependent methyltransferase [Shewanella sp. A25]|nr:class I SAM-dependent methyltransferase [Shewanella shenzhenensis]
MRRCPLCQNTQTVLLLQDKKRSFYVCQTCGLAFADAKSHLPPAAERQRYGRSRIASKQRQLSQFILPFLEQMQQHQKGSLIGLNFGRILDQDSLISIERAGHTLNQYDPFFAPDHETLKQEYDFICCYRVFEHFQYPVKEWSLLSRLLKPSGWLAISTPLLVDLEGFAKWHYKNNLTHVSFYQRQTFEHLAHNSDFELLFAAKDLVLMQKTS